MSNRVSRGCRIAGKLWGTLLLLGLLLPGCWDYNEISDVFFVTALAVDKGDQKAFQLTVECAVVSEFSKETSGKVAPSVLYSMEGNSVAELARKMNRGLERELVYSHTRLVIFGESIAREGLEEFLDFMERSREIRDDFQIVVVRGRNAKDVLMPTNPTEHFATGKIQKQLKMFMQEWGGDPDVRLRDLVNAKLSPGREGVAAAISIQGNPEQAVSTDHSNLTKPKAQINVSGLAVFEGFKLKHFYGLEDTRSYLIIVDRLRSTSVTAECGPDKLLTARVNYSNTSITTWREGRTAHFHVKVYGEGMLESSSCDDELNEWETVNDYEQLINAKLKSSLESSIRLAQDKKLDIYGLGEHMYRKDPTFFKSIKKEWGEYFADAEITVDVALNIRRFGLKVKGIGEDDT